MNSILLALCTCVMFCGCKQIEYVDREVIHEIPVEKEITTIQDANKFTVKEGELLKIKTFYERVGYDSYLTKNVNDWIEAHKNDIEVLDIQITGIDGSVHHSSAVMIVYKELNRSEK